MSLLLPLENLAKLCGFGGFMCADGYVFRPRNLDEVRLTLEVARRSGRSVVLRGAGRSYGDASISAENVALDLCEMNRILSWDPSIGVIESEAGATIEDVWRESLPDGWWPPVVSGTMFPTLAGALAMNIHGKNNFRLGTLGEHVLELDLMLSSGELLTLTPSDPRFKSVVSSAGLLGVITRVKLQLKKVANGLLKVHPVSVANWDEQFAAFERFVPDADYAVSWMDCFSSGRGLFHAAYHLPDPQPETLKSEAQDLPDRIMGLVPKAQVWRALKLMNNRTGMRLVNALKYHSSKIGKPHELSLVEFSFLFDYVPGWQRSYGKNGFIQYQSFVPAEHAKRVFREQISMAQAAQLEPFLGVLKRHRPDSFLFSHGVDGYSLALDFKVGDRWNELETLCKRMNELVLNAGGRFYFAKDSTLSREDLPRYLGSEALDRFYTLKSELDPEGLFTSALAERLGLTSG